MSITAEFVRARLFAELAQDLAAQPDATTAVNRVLSQAVALTGCESAGLWVLTPSGNGKLRACTEPGLAELADKLIAEQRRGTVWDCLVDADAVWVSDTSREPRWQLHDRSVDAAFVKHASPRAMAGFALRVDGQVSGVLVLGSSQAGFFDQEVLATARIFAQHAAIGLEVTNRAVKTRNLEGALDSNRRIGVAIGILMSRQHITESRAFDLLRRDSQNAHRKLRDVAEHVILTGQLPSAEQRVLAS
ncbi:GAF and ANTAR domain-containing protein [Jatrophihabitans telluris]|uniref:GAF and ANTAR domain-containing protein n=1 Tax=Jatrophihabitans telluris TaxID=2038343 RepID=A0ABY4QW22_9ACTN|nr:GAF and ANTAR domain-containing protein [Jatrophihabitans telluris]UQX87467.1 GAF and ANTAR domain-containing protein [Jatrophihabitans telluris]